MYICTQVLQMSDEKRVLEVFEKLIFDTFF
jgi:hypothetical protein